ncbi:putative secreted effector protein [Blumeria graminis f. sp. tritici 96224]|uniref:Putative secreted effector protein n=1 Tax=Blumeria graminis f. sp. tritici 96224 TaxID=1268274 RepID=A0A656KGL5_BLUGR|nr:putative secreted effector protein [Blumeria graminis f. sp. tritici 96224]
MSHLISVSAEYKYICPSRTKFTTDIINILRDTMLTNRNIDGLMTFNTFGRTTLSYVFDHRIIDGGQSIFSLIENSC